MRLSLMLGNEYGGSDTPSRFLSRKKWQERHGRLNPTLQIRTLPTTEATGTAAGVYEIQQRQLQIAEALKDGTSVAELEALIKAGQVFAVFEIATQLAELNRILRDEVITTREECA